VKKKKMKVISRRIKENSPWLCCDLIAIKHATTVSYATLVKSWSGSCEADNMA
jgi:hypothetical protein